MKKWLMLKVARINKQNNPTHIPTPLPTLGASVPLIRELAWSVENWMMALTKREVMTCAKSPRTLMNPALQKYHPKTSVKAQAKFGLAFPVLSLQSCSFSALVFPFSGPFPRAHLKRFIRGGLTSPFSNLILYSSASFHRLWKLACNFLDNASASLSGGRRYRSSGASCLAAPRAMMLVIHEKVMREKILALASGKGLASSNESGGGGGGCLGFMNGRGKEW